MKEDASGKPLRRITVEIIFEPARGKTLRETEAMIRNQLAEKSYILNAAVLTSEPRGPVES